MSIDRKLLLVSAACIATVAAQSADPPDWQTAAGGKAAFEVASVKPSKVPKIPNFPLDNGNAKTPGGRLSVAFGLSIYIAFAHKLNPQQAQAMSAQLPKWAKSEFFEIEARAAGNPTKDQMRLMMQSLLARTSHKSSIRSKNRERSNRTEASFSVF